jgi:protein-tyrosine phosphatase
MAAALFDAVVGDLDEPVSVGSAGLLPGGAGAPPHVVTVMAAWGADVSAHRSRQLSAEAVGDADLILGMERRHAREAVLLVPSAFERTFTLKELLRRGDKTGPRADGLSLAAWLAAVNDGRQRRDLVGRSPDDEVADPLGGPVAAFRATAVELADAVHRLARLLWPDGPWDGATG